MKKLSLLLAIIICLSSFNIYAADEAPAEDIVISQEAIAADGFLRAFDLTLPDNTDYTRKVTRIEFLRAVVSAIRATGGDGASFGDLAGNDFAMASAAVKLGIISDAESFDPEREITAAECYKMAVVAAGYSLEAELHGGYPTGYMYAASYADISEGISLGAYDTVTYADFAVIMRNLCEANIKYQSAFGDENGFTVTPGKTILTTYHDIKTAVGLCQADRFGSIHSTAVKAGEGRVIIGNINYKYQGESYLGYKVKAYYTEEVNTREIVYLEPTDNKVFTIDAESIADTQNGRLVYYDGARTRDVSLVQSPSIIHNGVASGTVLSFAQVKAFLTNGSLTLIDNNEDNVYDVVQLDKFYYMFISKINNKKDAIYDVNNSDNAINITDETQISVYLNGLKADISAVGVNMGAMVYRSENSEKIKIELTDKKLNGKIDGIDNVNDVVTCKGVSYEYSDYFAAYYLDSVMSYESSALVFAPDGRLVAIDSPENNLMIGILLDAGQTTGIGAKYVLKLYTEDGKVMEYNLADKVTIDNLPKKDDSDIMANHIGLIPLDDAPVNARVPERFIAFALNGDDEIVKIDTIYTGAERAGGIMPNPTQNDGDGNPLTYPGTGEPQDGSEQPGDSIRVFKTVSNKKYKMNIFENDVALGTNTTVYNFNTTVGTKEELRFSISDRSQFADDQTIPASDNLYAINVGQTLTAEYVLYTTATVKANDSSKGGLVEKISNGIDPNGDAAIKIQVYAESDEFQTIYVPQSIYDGAKRLTNVSDVSVYDETSRVSCGDYIRYTADSQNIVSSLILDYDYDEDAFAYGAQATHNAERDYYKGYVYSSVPENPFYVLATSTAYNTVPTELIMDASTKKVLFTWGYIVVYDVKNQSATRVKAADVITWLDDKANCDYAVMRQGWGQGKMLVVYRNR